MALTRQRSLGRLQPRNSASLHRYRDRHRAGAAQPRSLKRRFQRRAAEPLRSLCDLSVLCVRRRVRKLLTRGGHNSSIADETASGFSRGTKCPAPGTIRLSTSLVGSARSAVGTPGESGAASRCHRPRHRGRWPASVSGRPASWRSTATGRGSPGAFQVAVAIGVDHDLDKVGVVERRRRSIERLVGEAPGRRPGLPEKTAERAAVGGQSGAPTLGVEIPLVPERLLRRRRGRPRRRQGVLNGIAADEDSGTHSIGVECGRDARRASSPVVTGNGKPREANRIGEVDEILPDAARSAIRGRSRHGARRPVPTQTARALDDPLERAWSPRRPTLASPGNRAAGRWESPPRCCSSRCSRPVSMRRSIGSHRLAPGRAKRRSRSAIADDSRNVRRLILVLRLSPIQLPDE